MRTTVLALFGLPGHWEALIVILAILLLFGGRKLPELARGLGRGLRVFKKELHGIKDGLEDTDELDETPPAKLESKSSDAPKPETSGGAKEQSSEETNA